MIKKFIAWFRAPKCVSCGDKDDLVKTGSGDYACRHCSGYHS